MKRENHIWIFTQVSLAEKVCTTIGMDKIFFQNSGTEANEAMIKMARKYGIEKYGPNKYHIVTAKNGFHGRTFGAMSATGQPGNARKMGDYFMDKLRREIPHVVDVRGQGLLVGVEFDDTISGVDVKHACLDRHLLITAIGSHIIRMIPPLIITEEDCDKAVAIIKESVESLAK